MKITVDVDCTPEEARTFLGLPDLKPMQEALLAQIQERLTIGLQATDPEALLRTWLPSAFPTTVAQGTGLHAAGVQAMEQVTKAMMANLDNALGREPKK